MYDTCSPEARSRQPEPLKGLFQHPQPTPEVSASLRKARFAEAVDHVLANGSVLVRQDAEAILQRIIGVNTKCLRPLCVFSNKLNGAATLKYRNGFFMHRRYEKRLARSSEFCLTVPAVTFLSPSTGIYPEDQFGFGCTTGAKRNMR